MNDQATTLLLLGWPGFLGLLSIFVLSMPERLARFLAAILIVTWLWIFFGGFERWTS